MKRALASAALIGLALGPAAHAQVSCGELRRVMTEAETDFEDITGREIEDGFYELTYLIGGARQCYAELDIVADYYCIFVHDEPSTAFSAYRYRLGEMRTCLSSWKQTALKEEPPLRGDGYRDLEGVQFEGSGEYAYMTWLVSVEQHIVNDSAHYHVRIELEYL